MLSPNHRFFRLMLVLLLALSLAPAHAAKPKKSKSKTTKKASQAPDTLEQWAQRAQRAESSSNESWGALVQDLKTGEPIFAYFPERKLIPASNRKIFTAAVALELLGPDHLFTTELGLKGPAPDGSATYRGDLVLRSDGDPSLTSVFMQRPDNPATLFDNWAKDLAATGIKTIEGNVVLEAGAFGPEQSEYPTAWDRSHRNHAYGAIPSAIAINQNLLRLEVRPGASSGKYSRLQVYPSEEGIDILNAVRTSGGGGTGVSADFDETDRNLVLTGRVREDSDAEVMLVPLRKPLHYASQLLKHSLEQAGVKFTGSVKLDTALPAADPVPLHIVAQNQSPTLLTLLDLMMSRSNNFIAEQVWRGTAVGVTGRGDTQNARQVELEWFKRHNLAWIEPGYDGSGLSRKNKFSAQEMVLVCRAMLDSPLRELALDIFPVEGRSGTMRKRWFSENGARVAAKTGTLAGASALTGFIYDKEGEPRYVFSVIGNAPGETNGRLANRINQLMRLLVRQMDREKGQGPLIGMKGVSEEPGKAIAMAPASPDTIDSDSSESLGTDANPQDRDAPPVSGELIEPAIDRPTPVPPADLASETTPPTDPHPGKSALPTTKKILKDLPPLK